VHEPMSRVLSETLAAFSGLMERAAAEGQEVLRRPEASPLAVLGVVIVKQAQAAHVA
jgi:hypothetical protein